jgi:hypothetical protein
MQNDADLRNLLDLHDCILEQEEGYWIKIEAWLVEATRHMPHGVRYSLTLHDKYGKRVLGYDNAHEVKPPKKFKYAGRRWPYDHRHRHMTDKGEPYEFKDAQQLLVDFFADVDRVLQDVKEKR